MYNGWKPFFLAVSFLSLSFVLLFFFFVHKTCCCRKNYILEEKYYGAYYKSLPFVSVVDETVVESCYRGVRKVVKRFGVSVPRLWCLKVYKMLEELVVDYAAYFKLDISSGFQTVQDVIDNMLTRLEELASVLQMIKLKHSECGHAVTHDLCKYRKEVTALSKKVLTLNKVIEKLQSNIDVLEKQVENAEREFGVNNDNMIRSFLKPFLRRNKDSLPPRNTLTLQKVEFESVLDNFENLATS